MQEVTLLSLHLSNEHTPGNAQITAPKGAGIPHLLSGTEITRLPPASRTQRGCFLPVPYRSPGFPAGTAPPVSQTRWEVLHPRPRGCPPKPHPRSPEGGGCCPSTALPGTAGPAPRSPGSLPASSSPQDSSRRLRLSRSGNPREAAFRGEGKSLLRGAEEGAGCGRLERRRTRWAGGRGGEGGERSGALASAACSHPRRRSARMSDGDGGDRPGAISYALPSIPSNKLPDLRFISRGAYGTVSAARHADWRVPVALKCLQGPLLDR